MQTNKINVKADIKKLSGSEIEISGELSAADFDQFIKKSVSHFAANLELPGFRKGHAPENKVIEQVGEGALLEKAAHFAMRDIYPQIIRENNIEAIGSPDISITKLARGNSLEFKIKTNVLPEVELPDYKTIAQKISSKKETVVVEDKEIDDSLEYLRKSRAAKPEKEGDAKVAESSSPDTSKKASAEQKLPELNDEFAKSLGKFETLEDLKKTIRENITFEKEMKVKEKKRADMLDAIASATKMDVPEIMIESEKEKMIVDLKNNIENMGLKWKDYLKNIKKEEADLKKEWTKDAEKRVKFGIILKEIGDKENVEISEKEANQYAEQMMSRYPESERSKIDKSRVIDYARNILINEKIFQMLEGSEPNTQKNADTDNNK